MSFAIEGSDSLPIRSITRQKPCATFFFQSCGKREQGLRVKLKTCSHLRLLTGALTRIRNREVREADPIQPLYAVHNEVGV